jgi:TRAP-type uncharacterized transport system fused permease subunit
VALAAFAGASIAKADPMATGFEAMRLGTIIYFIPFFFVYNPALLLQGPIGEILIVCGSAVIGVILLSAALQGYLIGLGLLPEGGLGLPARVLIGLGGLTFAVPGGELTGLSHLELTAIAFGLTASGIALVLLMRRATGASG